MKIKEISVWKDRKIQIEEFEPYSFGFGMTAELEEGEDVPKAYEKLEYWVDGKIQIETMKWKNPQQLVRNMTSKTKQPNPEIAPF